MATISDSAIAGAARSAGLSGQPLAIAVAIALAESGGNTNAHNAIPPDNSYGLWQINMLGSMGPQRRQQFNLTNNEALYDPAINARVMFSLSGGGTNWRPWTTYTRGTYLRFMSRANAVSSTDATLPNNGSNLTPVGLKEGLNGLSGLLENLQSPKFWLRVGLLILGAGIATYGFMKMTGDNQLSSGTKSLASGLVGLVPGGGTVVTGVKAVSKVVK